MPTKVLPEDVLQATTRPRNCFVSTSICPAASATSILDVLGTLGGSSADVLSSVHYVFIKQ